VYLHVLSYTARRFAFLVFFKSSTQCFHAVGELRGQPRFSWKMAITQWFKVVWCFKKVQL